MRKFLLSIAAFAALAPAAVIAAPAQHTFQYNGQTYSYSAERQTNGALILVGDANDGENFRLNVVKDHVEGQMGSTAVDFFISKAAVEKLAAQIPLNAPTAIASN